MCVSPWRAIKRGSGRNTWARTTPETKEQSSSSNVSLCTRRMLKAEKMETHWHFFNSQYLLVSNEPLAKSISWTFTHILLKCVSNDDGCNCYKNGAKKSSKFTLFIMRHDFWLVPWYNLKEEDCISFHRNLCLKSWNSSQFAEGGERETCICDSNMNMILWKSSKILYLLIVRMSSFETTNNFLIRKSLFLFLCKIRRMSVKEFVSGICVKVKRNRELHQVEESSN